MRPLLMTGSALVCLIAAGTLPAGNLTAGDSQLVKGIIKEVTVFDKRVSILVEETPKGQLQRIVFHLHKDTQISYSDKKKATASDLKVGQRVSVQYNGSLDDSDPPQAGADVIVIEVSAKSK